MGNSFGGDGVQGSLLAMSTTEGSCRGLCFVVRPLRLHTVVQPPSPAGSCCRCLQHDRSRDIASQPVALSSCLFGGICRPVLGLLAGGAHCATGRSPVSRLVTCAQTREAPSVERGRRCPRRPQ
jgi:hypothetical protein